ncbi:hypothetical protein PRIPAC_73405 [Pristionchus pacificus]|nr:hypothetical protein PRIPAC_73405 [Pristionchus pacificus]
MTHAKKERERKKRRGRYGEGTLSQYFPCAGFRMTSIIAIFVIFSLVTPIRNLPADLDCHKGSSVHERWCFLPLIYSQKGHDFDAASSLCTSRGSHLPEITTEDDNEAIKNYGVELWTSLECDRSGTWNWKNETNSEFMAFKEDTDRTCSNSNDRVIVDQNGIWVKHASTRLLNNILCVRPRKVTLHT